MQFKFEVVVPLQNDEWSKLCLRRSGRFRFVPSFTLNKDLPSLTFPCTASGMTLFHGWLLSLPLLLMKSCLIARTEQNKDLHRTVLWLSAAAPLAPIYVLSTLPTLVRQPAIVMRFISFSFPFFFAEIWDSRDCAGQLAPSWISFWWNP